MAIEQINLFFSQGLKGQIVCEPRRMVLGDIGGHKGRVSSFSRKSHNGWGERGQRRGHCRAPGPVLAED